MLTYQIVCDAEPSGAALLQTLLEKAGTKKKYLQVIGRNVYHRQLQPIR